MAEGEVDPSVTTALLDNGGGDTKLNGEEREQPFKSSTDKNRPATKGRLTCILALSVFASVIGCSFQFGFQTGVLNTPQKLLQDEFKYKFGRYNSTSPDVLTDDQTRLLWSITVSIFGAGGVIGGFTGSYIATKLGRKKMMLANNLILVVAVVLMIMSRYVGELALLVAGRFIVGIHSGFSTVVAPLYINEISPVNLRGSLGTLNQLGITSGILLSQTLGLTVVFGNEKMYHLLFGVPAIAALLQLLILPFCPESPPWLHITKSRVDEASKALKRFRGTGSSIEGELAAYSEEKVEQDNREQISFGMLFRKSYLRTPLLIAVVMQLSQQLSGIIAVLNYSTSIFQSVGLAETDAQYATLGTSGAIVVMTIVSVLFMDRIGRRPLHLGGLTGCLVSMIMITVAFFLQDTQSWAKYLSIVSLVLFIISFAVGPGSIPWFITAELFDQAARPYAISIATVVNWLANFISGLVFPHMQKGLGNYVFVPFIVLLVIFVIFTFFKVPETKNKSTEEIVNMFKKSPVRRKEDESPMEDLSEEK